MTEWPEIEIQFVNVNEETSCPASGELAFIFVLVLLLFGPEKLPELARNIGKGLREIRKVSDEFRAQLKIDDD